VREAARHFDPDLFLVDKSPSGLMGDLRCALQLLRTSDHPPRTVLGLRDILDEPEATRDEWRAEGWVPFIERAYDEVWIYGDPNLFDAPRAYGWPDWLIERVRHLGYLVPSISDSERAEARQKLDADGRPLALVTVGGGEDGERVVATYLEAARRGLLPSDLKSVVVLGPCMPDEVQAGLLEDAPPGVHVERFVPDLAPSIAAADVVVGMAGYNTVCELLAGRTPAILAPRVKPRREQWLRARCLAERGIAQYLEPDRLVPKALAEAVRRALERGRPEKDLPATDGLEQVARRIDRILPGASDHQTDPAWPLECVAFP
jgi:predicted glycosyltransferase